MKKIYILLILTFAAFAFSQDCPDEMDGYYCTTDLNVLQSFIDLNDCISTDQPLLLGEQEWEDGRLVSFDLDGNDNEHNVVNCGYSDNQLKNIPEEIGNLSELRFLQLRDMGIESVPESIGDLSNLDKLRLKVIKNDLGIS